MVALASPAELHRPAMRVEDDSPGWSLFAILAVTGGRIKASTAKNRLFKPFSWVNAIGGFEENGGFTI